MPASVRSVNVDNVKRLMEAVRIGDGFDMEKILRAASDIGGYGPETNARATNPMAGRERLTLSSDSSGLPDGWA